MRVANADNNQVGAGAVWDFSSLFKDGLLNSSEKTQVKRLEFRLKNIQPFRPNQFGKIVPELINLETKVFSKLGTSK